jgi:NAD(P)-dependent dehydrogenase (short-subunit alcohol dehydrogenase family)
MSSKLLVVLGATGHQGRAIIDHFQEHRSTWRIRGLTRDPLSKIAMVLADRGVEMVQADSNDVSSLIAAFDGADYIFAYTDFGSILLSSLVMGKFESGEITAPVGAECFKIELQQGKNIADAAATISGLRRLIWSSLPHVANVSAGKYTQVFHFDSKAASYQYMLSLEGLQGKVSAVHMGAFATNFGKGLDPFAFRKVRAGIAFCHLLSEIKLMQERRQMEMSYGLSHFLLRL